MTKKAKTASRSRRGALVPKAILDKREANIPLTSGGTINAETLLADLRSLIHSARQRVATLANSAQTMLYWHVGRRLLKENLQEGRAAYGKRILVTLSQELKAEFGDGFSYSSLTRESRRDSIPSSKPNARSGRYLPIPDRGNYAPS